MPVYNQTEINYNSASFLKNFLESEGLGMRKKHGQNFLLNPGAREALVDALEAEQGSLVWEIGPGLGAMTAPLLEKGLYVRAFEIDSGFIRILKKIFAGDKNFSIVEGDVMKTWKTEKPANYLLGNLPYNIAATLLADMTENRAVFTRMVVTVQKEVARRMCAVKGSADYSSLSVLCASSYNVRPIMQISGGSFYPRPRVDSTGVLLTGKKAEFPNLFPPLVRALFSSRRKTLKNNLSAFIASRFGNYAAPAEICAHVLNKSGLSGGERAEQLALEEFLTLAFLLDECDHKTRDVNRG